MVAAAAKMAASDRSMYARASSCSTPGGAGSNFRATLSPVPVPKIGTRSVPSNAGGVNGMRKSVESGADPGPRRRLEAGLLAPPPEQVVDVAGSHRALQLTHDQLDGVHGRGPHLGLGLPPRLEELAVLDGLDQGPVEDEHPFEPQHVRYEVVREEREALEVEERPDVRRRQLGPLEEWHRPVPIRRHVAVHRHLDQKPDEARCRPAGRGHQGVERAVEAVEEETSEVVERSGEEGHELVDRRAQPLAEHKGAVLDRETGQLASGKWP